MQSIFDTIDLLFPKELNWELWKQYKNNEPFSDNVISFLNALSSSILNDQECRPYPDLITFAFFCRKANILALKKQYVRDELRLGRGIVFHIAPSNVPINFGYSLILGLLSGCYNIVRVSSKEFTQVDLIVKHLEKIAALDEHQEVIKKIVLVRYDRTSAATDYFSSFCNVRIIWGGDETIKQIRKSVLPPRSFDITFADRYSFALINADKLAKEADMQKIGEKFYNDTYLFDQNACSAPHLVVWTGDKKNVVDAQNIFWSSVENEVKKRYKFQSVLAIDKLTAFYRQSLNMPVHYNVSPDNSLIRVNLEELPRNIDTFRCSGGYFSEYYAHSLNELIPIVNEKYQTLAYYGYSQDKLKEFVLSNHLTGVDRVVPIGKTADFSLTWDGYNLIEMLSRICCVE
jgi:hypothetical protein